MPRVVERDEPLLSDARQRAFLTVAELEVFPNLGQRLFGLVVLAQPDEAIAPIAADREPPAVFPGPAPFGVRLAEQRFGPRDITGFAYDRTERSEVDAQRTSIDDGGVSDPVLQRQCLEFGGRIGIGQLPPNRDCLAQ